MSDLGRVRALTHCSQYGRRVRKTPLALRPNLTTNGYHCVQLHANDRRWPVAIHRLVLLAFVGEPPEGAEGSHLDGDKANNRLSNLRWESHRENCALRTAHGTQQSGEKMWASRLTEAEVLAMRAEWPDTTCDRLAERFGVNRATVHNAVIGKTWAHLPGAHPPASR